ncbi:MAG: hypothetical protein RLZZ161_945, partial [Bacteroidota bacterium]
MKRSFKILLVLLLSAQTVQAQITDTTKVPDIAAKNHNSVNLPSKDTIFTLRPKTIKVSFESESGSPAMPLAITGRFLLGGYIPSERISETEERLKTQLRGGIAATMQLNVADKFYVRRHQMGGIRFNDDAFRLVFQGNGAYLGETLDARIHKATQWDVVELGLGFEKNRMLTSGKGHVWFTGSINPGWLQSYSAVNNFRATVFTDTLAQHVDVFWGGSLHRARSGFGLTVNTDVSYELQKGSWKEVSMGLSNFGLYYTGSLNTYSRLPAMANSTVRLESATTSLNRIFRGDWFGDRVDTIKQALGLDSSQSGKTLLAPFTIYVTGSHKHLGWYALNYRNLPGYLPMLDWWPNDHLGIGKLRIYPGLSLGGFDTWNINLQSNWNWKPMQRGGLYFNLRLEGLESLAMPGRLNG